MKVVFLVLLTISLKAGFAFDGFEGEYSGTSQHVGAKSGVASSKLVFSTIEIEKNKSSHSHLIKENTGWKVGNCEAWAKEEATVEYLPNQLIVAHKKVEFDWCDGKGIRKDTQEGFGYCTNNACHIAYPKSASSRDYFFEDNYRLTKKGLEVFGMYSQISKEQFSRYHGLKAKK